MDQDVGAAAATGDGDIMMRLVPAYQTVESMRNGMSPNEAAADSIKRIIKKYPIFSGAIIAANKTGQVGAACHNVQDGYFPYAVARGAKNSEVKVSKVKCI